MEARGPGLYTQDHWMSRHQPRGSSQELGVALEDMSLSAEGGYVEMGQDV